MTSRPTLLAIAWLVSVAISTSIAAGEEWPQWRGLRADGVWNPPANLYSKFPDAGLQPAWSAEIGPGYSGISVSKGRVYTMDRPWQQPASDQPSSSAIEASEAPAKAPAKKPGNQERIVCLDGATGKLVWQFAYEAPYGDLDYGKGPRCTPMIHDGRVYTLGSVGHFTCVDAATGKLLWQKDLVKDHGAKIPIWGLAASIVIEENLAIVHAGQQPGGSFVAYDRITGEEIWRSFDDIAGYSTPIIISHANRRILIGWTPNFIVAIDVKSGEVLWKEPYKVTYGVSIASPIVHDGIVLVCGYWEGSKAFRLDSDATKVELLWEENRFLRGLMSTPLVKNGQVYLLDKQHGIVSFKIDAGEKLWSDENQLTPRNRNPQISLVWLGDSSRAIGLNANGELLLVELRPDGFTELSRSKIIGETWAHPAFAGDTCYARDDEKIVAVKLVP